MIILSKRTYCTVGAVALLTVLILGEQFVMSAKVQGGFEESQESLSNPDRGFYIQVNTGDPDKIAEAAEDVRVILLAYDIEDYAQEEDIPEKKLNELERALQRAEKEHLGVVFRAAYGFHKEVKEPKELKAIRRHIKQICTVLNDHAEELLVVQAGMLGEYGEWHSSRFLDGSEEDRRESRLYVLKQWEKYLDPEVRVAVRRPKFVREAWEEGILPDRLGVHNDALLSTESDMGTYDDPLMDREAELAWMRDHLVSQFNGGEMPTPGPLNDPQHADLEFSMLHLSYLNLRYNRKIIDGWSRQQFQGENARQYLENHLGYRLYISGLSANMFISGEDLSSSGLELTLSLTNSGYAQLPGKYKLFLAVDNGTTGAYQPVQLPALNQISNGQTVTAQLAVTVSEELLEEDAPISIGIKIAPAEGASRRDCVLLANTGVNRQDGINDFMQLSRVPGSSYMASILLTRDQPHIFSAFPSEG